MMYSAYRVSLVAQMVKESTCNVGDLGSISGWEDPLEEGMATHSGEFSPGESPWTDQPGGLQSKGSQRVGQD